MSNVIFRVEDPIKPEQVPGRISELEVSESMMRVFRHELETKPAIIESRLSSKLGSHNKLMARKCELVSIDYESAKLFANANHTSGFALDTNEIIGLKHDGELVYAFMFNTEKKILHRIVAKNYTTIVGGYSKLLKESLDRYREFTTPNNWRWGVPGIYKEINLCK